MGGPVNGLLFARTDGDKVVEMSEVKEVSVEMDELSADESMRTYLDLKTASATFTVELDKPLPPVDLARILGLPVVVVPKLFSCVWCDMVPCRTHRKKRIRKKWLKRYGRRPAYSKEEEEPFIYCGTEGYMLFIGLDTWKKVREGFPNADVRPFLIFDYLMAKGVGKHEEIKTD